MNATAQHTLGPWSYDAPFFVAPDPTGAHPDIYIAEIVYQDSEGRIASEEQQEANARLIAAAPELLDALMGIIRLSELGFEDSLKEPEENGNFATYERAKRAIAKATGAAS